MATWTSLGEKIYSALEEAEELENELECFFDGMKVDAIRLSLQELLVEKVVYDRDLLVFEDLDLSEID